MGHVFRWLLVVFIVGFGGFSVVLSMMTSMSVVFVDLSDSSNNKMDVVVVKITVGEVFAIVISFWLLVELEMVVVFAKEVVVLKVVIMPMSEIEELEMNLLSFPEVLLVVVVCSLS